jgi:hypothetical protein
LFAENALQRIDAKSKDENPKFCTEMRRNFSRFGSLVVFSRIKELQPGRPKMVRIVFQPKEKT